MGSEAFLRLQALFDEALQHPPAQRLTWLDSRTDLDPALAAELRRLLLREDGENPLPDGLPVRLLAAAMQTGEESESPRLARAGRFALLEELGRGGMGCVYRGVREEGGVRQEAAIKILRSDLRNSSAFARFLHERRVLAKLDHPGIARLLDSGVTEDGTPFVAMELVSGRPILEYCAAENLDVRARVVLLRQVLAAVGHAHRALVVHRDIKPSNVMVDAEGRVRLLDFGIAKDLLESAPSTVTATSDRYFTPSSAAPEQLTGAPTTVACDVYALGALLYELVSGAPVFAVHGKRAAEIERLILSTPPRSLEHAYMTLGDAQRLALAGANQGAWRARLRGDLDNIVQRALRKEPEARYASVDAMDQDLECWLSNRPVRASGAGYAYRLRKFVRRNTLAVAASTLMICGAMVAATLVVQQGIVAARERDRAREALATMRDAFVAADPAGASGGGANARSILDVASKRIAENLHADPELYAELTADIGEVRMAIGIVDSDDQALLAAVDWARDHGNRQDLLLRLQRLKARRLVARHSFDDADGMLRELERSHASDPEVKLLRGKYWLARYEPQRAIEQLLPLAGPLSDRLDSNSALDAVWQLAEAQRIGGDPQSALASLRAAQDKLSARFPPDHALILLTRLRAVQELIDLGRLDESISESRAVISTLEARYGRASSVTALAYSTLGYALSMADRLAESIAPYRSAATAYSESLGPNHITTARATFNVAELQASVDPSEGSTARLFEQAIDAASVARQPTDPLVIYFRIRYAQWRDALKDAGGAREALLPGAVALDLTTSDDENVVDYLTLLQKYFGPFVCHPESATGSAAVDASAKRRAEGLFCRGKVPTSEKT